MFVISDLLGGCKNAEILEIILENYDEDLTARELSRMADTTRGHIYKYTRLLVEKGILTKTKRKGGKTLIYRFNKDNRTAKVLMLLEHELVSSGLKRKIAEMEK